MSEPFLAEIKMFGFNFPPRGWAFCDGQILPINQNQSLFALIGTTYGGDGRTTFALPGMRGRTPVHRGDSISRGQKTGNEAQVLQINEMPQHTHGQRSTSTSDAATSSPIPTDNVLSPVNNLYRDALDNVAMESSTLANTGASQGHQNMQPYLVVEFCIALTGLFPSRN
ncbi:MAG: phage tail protein [Planctomycetes bacterium]|nr:phage tail protein [Planctomycetota bacterium]